MEQSIISKNILETLQQLYYPIKDYQVTIFDFIKIRYSSITDDNEVITTQQNSNNIGNDDLRIRSIMKKCFIRNFTILRKYKKFAKQQMKQSESYNFLNNEHQSISIFQQIIKQQFNRRMISKQKTKKKLNLAMTQNTHIKDNINLNTQASKKIQEQTKKIESKQSQTIPKNYKQKNPELKVFKSLKDKNYSEQIKISFTKPRQFVLGEQNTYEKQPIFKLKDIKNIKKIFHNKFYNKQQENISLIKQSNIKDSQIKDSSLVQTFKQITNNSISGYDAIINRKIFDFMPTTMIKSNYTKYQNIKNNQNIINANKLTFYSHKYNVNVQEDNIINSPNIIKKKLYKHKSSSLLNVDRQFIPTKNQTIQNQDSQEIEDNLIIIKAYKYHESKITSNTMYQKSIGKKTCNKLKIKKYDSLSNLKHNEQIELYNKCIQNNINQFSTKNIKYQPLH